MTLPTMKAYTIPSFRTLKLNPSASVPVLPPNSALLLLRITHVSLNPADKECLNLLPPYIPFLRPNPTPGMDFAGEIVSIGSAVPAEMEFSVGDRVCGAVAVKEALTGQGTLAGFAVVRAELAVRMPAVDGWGPREAVGVMGIAGQTAALMVGRVVTPTGVGEERGRGAMEGMKVLVNGASGGVGTMLVQICKGLGAKVVGVCSGGNRALVERLGADEVVDYRVYDPLEGFLAQRFGDQQFDAVFDCAGSQVLYSHSPSYLKPDGNFISIVGGWSQGVVPFIRNYLRPRILGGTPRSYELLLLNASSKTAKEVATWVEQGVIKEAVIDSEFSMEEAVKAFERLATGRAKGKIVIKVDST